jgi:formate C-acetyltransferase
MKDENLREGLTDVLEGIKCYHARALEKIKTMGAPAELICALSRVPFSPAQSVYEAIVCINFMLSLDGWDNVGRLDSYLEPYYKGEDITEPLRCMMRSIQDNGMWSLTLGPDYNSVTYAVLRASQGLSRPLIQLRVRRDMPNELWELALERALSGGGQPSFFNEELIQSRLAHRLPHASAFDLSEFTGAGCTETCLEGMTYCGATDTTVNVLKIFEGYMRSHLARCKDFKSFYEGFCDTLMRELDGILAHINDYYNERAKRCFAPIRTLFVADCIDREKGYFQGGARYTYSTVPDSGMPNTADSLLAIKHLVFERGLYSPEEFITALDRGDPTLHARLDKCPHYGVADDEADGLVHDLTSRFYARFLENRLDLGEGFFPTVHQFDRHVVEGAKVGATPDGRRACSPLADSIAAVNGRATEGPTLMLVSAARYEQKDVYGMSVLNLSLSQSYPPEVLRSLIEGYFSLGGLQMQITAVDREILLRAREDPASYPDLIVRVGGFSERFCNLSDALKDAVIARTQFEA